MALEMFQLFLICLDTYFYCHLLLEIEILLVFIIIEVDVYAGRPAQGHSGNLTGNRRILKDTAADIFNRMQQWKVHQDRGCVLISNIFNLRMEM